MVSALQVQQLERSIGLKDLAMADLEQKVSELEVSTYDGVFIWKISDFARKRQEAIAGRTPAIFSPGAVCGPPICSRALTGAGRAWSSLTGAGHVLSWHQGDLGRRLTNLRVQVRCAVSAPRCLQKSMVLWSDAGKQTFANRATALGLSDSRPTGSSIGIYCKQESWECSSCSFISTYRVP